jgi:hypothetical protein
MRAHPLRDAAFKAAKALSEKLEPTEYLPPEQIPPLPEEWDRAPRARIPPPKPSPMEVVETAARRGTAQKVLLLRCGCGRRHFEPLASSSGDSRIWLCPKCQRVCSAMVP